MNFADAVEQVLKAERRPMSVADITKRALELRIIEPKSDDPTTYVRAAIRKDTRHREERGERPRFVRDSSGNFSLS